MPPLLLLGLLGGGGFLGIAAWRKRHPAPTKANKDGNPLEGAGKILGVYGQVLNLASNAESEVVKAAGGNQAQQDTARVAGVVGGSSLGPGVAAGFVTRDLVTDKLLPALGVNDKKTANRLGQVAGVIVGAGAVAGVPGVVGATIVEGVAQGADALIGAIGGKKVQAKVDAWAHNLDPTATGTAGAKVVHDVAGFIGGIFGQKQNNGPPPDPIATANAYQLTQQGNAIAAAKGINLGGGGIFGQLAALQFGLLAKQKGSK